MQISTDGKNWNQPNPIEVKTGTIIYVRYSDGTNQGDKYAAVNPILKYNVVYRPNGGTGKNITDSNRNYDTTYQTRVANTFTRLCYTFTGWKCSANNTIYAAGANYSNLTTTDGETVYMDAQWTLSGYMVTIASSSYYGNFSITGVESIKDSQVSRKFVVPFDTTYSANRNTLTFSNGAVVTGLESSSPSGRLYFKSWSSNSGTITADIQIEVNYTKEFTLYFYARNGYVNPSSIVAAPGTAISLPIPERVGYEFIGWFTSEEDGYEVDYSTMPAYDQSLYARWVAVYTVAIKGTYYIQPSAPGSNSSQGGAVKSYSMYHGTTFTSNGNKLTFSNGIEVTIPAKGEISDKTFSFTNFSPGSGTITKDTEIECNFSYQEKPKYTLTYDPSPGRRRTNFYTIRGKCCGYDSYYPKARVNV